MIRDDTNRNAASDDAADVALHALAWTLAEPSRAERLLATTGLDPDDLRHRIGDPAVLAAVLGFLEAHEPDLIAAATALERPAAALVAARIALETP